MIGRELLIVEIARHFRSKNERSTLMHATVRSGIVVSLGLVLFAVSACEREPSRSAVEDAVSADFRQQLAQLGSSPVVELSGESRTLRELAADERLRVRVSDEKCNPIGRDKFRCDVLLDLRELGALLSGDAGGPAQSDADSQRQVVYVLTKLGGKWRATEELR
jgi:hypothetical protein